MNYNHKIMLIYIKIMFFNINNISHNNIIDVANFYINQTNMYNKT